ncbi:unknown [Brachyspira sp. CAG:484]|nr:unknown [Brachyspira sp. CAG:484]
MSCLKNIVRAIILTLAVVGFLSLGGQEFVTKYITQLINPSPQTMLERAKKVGDFSALNEEFELEKASGMFGYNGVVAEHKASGQKFIVVDAASKPLFTQEDIRSDKLEEKIKNTLSKFKYQAISVDEIKVTKHGEMTSYGKSVPYARFNAKINRLPIGDVSGIISVAETKDGDARILISANEKSKYSQLISEEFFKNIK